jgi:hypothetical protein
VQIWQFVPGHEGNVVLVLQGQRPHLQEGSVFKPPKTSRSKPMQPKTTHANVKQTQIRIQSKPTKAQQPTRASQANQRYKAIEAYQSQLKPTMAIKSNQS